MSVERLGDNQPTFTIVTPCWNAADWIQETMLSVLNQSAIRRRRARLQYIVVDGASTDGTPELVRETLAKYVGDDLISATLVTEPDSGMYDALAKGLSRGDGDVYAYLNAGDLYAPAAFDAVLDARLGATDVDWLTGMRVAYNAAGEVIDARLPGPYRRRLFLAGMYGYRGGGRFGFLQQESTFWTRRLNDRIDFERLASFRLAGDAFLWRTFAEVAQLYVVYTHLGGFRFHGDHLSSDMSAYLDEMRPLVDKAGPIAWAAACVDLATQQTPVRVRRHLAGRRLLTWRHGHDAFRTSRLLERG